MKRSRVVGLAIVAALCVAAPTAYFHLTRSKLLSLDPSSSQTALISRLRDAGVVVSATYAAPAGGMIVNGSINGREVSIAVPRTWNSQVLLWVHGYTLPNSSTSIGEDPLAVEPTLGMLRHVYDQGYAVAASSYGKSGYAVKSATLATKRLRDALTSLHPTRTLLAGASMGGNIVMSLIERYPRDYDGAVSFCGVTESWGAEVKHLVDLRAVYQAYTKHTEYALPGDGDLRTSAVGTGALLGANVAGDLYRLWQLKRVVAPVSALFAAARAHPDGHEARMIRQIAAAGGVGPDVASFAIPLATVSIGMDDIVATAGGQPYGNTTVRYGGGALTPDQSRFLNREVARLRADPNAAAGVDQWYRTRGTFEIPLVAVQNRIDPLVPMSQMQGLRRIADSTGAGAHLATYVVPSMISPLPFGGVSGYQHCGFTRPQIASAWKILTDRVVIAERSRGAAIR